MEWQPMDDKARNGDDVLLWGPTLGCIVASYDSNGEDFPWSTLDGPNYHKDVFTHWMPLPQPPEIAKVEAINAATEIERLKTALRKIADWPQGQVFSAGFAPDDAEDMQELARKALSPAAAETRSQRPEK